MKQICQFPAVVDKISTLKDGSYKIVSVTQELGPEDAQILFGFAHKFIYILMAESEITKKELDVIKVPEYVPTEKGEKTPAQRLRAVLYRLWESKGKKDVYGQPCDSDSYYRQVMSMLIDQYKEKLD
jgi:hypothetical protein